MSSSSDLRAFTEEVPTGRFETATLDSLINRSLEESKMFAGPAAPVLDVITAPYPAASDPQAQAQPQPRRPSAPAAARWSPSPSSPEFLSKGSPVLDLLDLAPVAARPTAPTPLLGLEPSASAPPSPAFRAALAAPALASPALVAPALAAPTNAPRTRRASVRAATTARRRIGRHVLKLALLALVVACQPWWWNVGDLHAHVAVTAHK